MISRSNTNNKQFLFLNDAIKRIAEMVAYVFCTRRRLRKESPVWVLWGCNAVGLRGNTTRWAFV